MGNASPELSWVLDSRHHYRDFIDTEQYIHYIRLETKSCRILYRKLMVKYDRT